MRHQFSGELDSCGRDGRVGRGSSEQLLAAGSNRGRLMPSRSDTRVARRARVRRQTDRRLSAVRLNDRRRNRHRRHSESLSLGVSFIYFGFVTTCMHMSIVMLMMSITCLTHRHTETI